MRPFRRFDKYLMMLVCAHSQSLSAFNIDNYTTTYDQVWYQTATSYLPAFYSLQPPDEYTACFGANNSGDCLRLRNQNIADVTLLTDDLVYAWLALWIHAQGTTMSVSEIKALAVFQGEYGTQLFDRASQYIQDNPNILDPLVVW